MRSPSSTSVKVETLMVDRAFGDLLIVTENNAHSGIDINPVMWYN
jgi:hypothetical protein